MEGELVAGKRVGQERQRDAEVAGRITDPSRSSVSDCKPSQEEAAQPFSKAVCVCVWGGLRLP